MTEDDRRLGGEHVSHSPRWTLPPQIKHPVGSFIGLVKGGRSQASVEVGHPLTHGERFLFGAGLFTSRCPQLIGVAVTLWIIHRSSGACACLTLTDRQTGRRTER